jgi:DNA-directed RNA polymerase subunit RPC12/RpoP
MHRLRSKAILRRFRLTSCLVVINALGLIPAFGFLSYGVLKHYVQWIALGGAILGGVLLLMIFNMIMTSRLRCPLCMVPPLQNRGCSKHRDVQRIFGSHRLKVATSILGSGYFTCPYCGEKTVMKTREGLK